MSVLKKITQILKYVLLSMVLLFLIIVGAVNLPFVHKFLTSKTNSILEKSGIPAHIGKITLLINGKIGISELSMILPPGDTIIYASNLYVDISPIPLISKKVEINSITLNNAVCNVLTDTVTGNLQLMQAFQAGESKEEPKPENDEAKKKNSWVIDVKNIELKNIRFVYSDLLGGILVKQNLAKAEIDIDNFSLENQQIDVNDAVITKPAGSVAIWEGTKKTENDSTSSAAWNFSLKNLEISDILFTLDQPDDGQKMDVSLKKGNVSLEKLDLATSEILVNNIELDEPRVTFLFAENNIEKNDEQTGTKTFEIPQLPWTIKVNNTNIENAFFTTITGNDITDSITGNWLPVHDLNASFSNIGITPAGYNLNLDKLSLGLSDRLDIESGNVSFISDSEQNLDLQIQLSAHISEEKSILKKENHLNFITNITGNSEVININRLGLESTGGLKIDIDGKLFNPAQIPDSEFDLQIFSGVISRAELSPIVSHFSPEVKLPYFRPFIVSGRVRNLVKNPVFNFTVNSQSGRVNASGNFDLNKIAGELNASFDNILLSEMLGETFPEEFTGNVQAKGKKGKSKFPEGEILIQVDSVRYKNKTTRNIALSANALNNQATISVNAADSALNLNMEGHLNWMGENEYSAELNGNFDVDLFKMNLYNNPLATRGSISGSFNKENERINSSLEINNLSISNDLTTAIIDTTAFEWHSNDSIIQSDFKTDFLNASFTSHSTIDEFKNDIDSISFKNIINLDSTNFINLRAFQNIENFSFNSAIRHKPVFNLFYPDSVLNFNEIKIDISKTGMDSLVAGNISSEWIVFQNLKIIHPKILSRFEPDRITFEFIVDSIDDNEIHFGKLDLKLDVFPTYITNILKVDDKNGGVLHEIGFEVERKNELVTLKSSLLNWTINKNPWTISPPEFITWNISTKTLTAGLDMHFEDRYIGLKGQNTKLVELTLDKVEFKNFAFPVIVEYLPDGIINGAVKYSKSQTDNIDIDLQISKIGWNDVQFNLLELKGKLVSDSTGIKESEVLITADDSLSLALQLQTDNTKNEFKLNSKFSNFHFQIIEPFIKEFASDLHGRTDGEISVANENNKIAFNGEIYFNDFGLKVIPLKTWLTIPDNKIEIKKNLILFNNFTVIDSLKRPLTVNGNIKFTDKDNIDVDLKVEADKIQLMNTTESKDVPLFGSIIINSELSILGSLFSPSIKGNIELESGTNLTYQLIQDLSVKGSQTDVVFASITDSLTVIYPETYETKRTTKMPNIQTTISINPNSKLNLKIADLYNVDISIEGNGLLNYNMLPNNTMSLNGAYEIKTGECKLKITGWPIKDFTITPGSSFTWSGSIDNPDLNLEATSKVRGSYTNPIDNKSRVVDFIVSMKLNNKLSELEIVFGVQSPDQYITSVLSSLSTDEMMRQAVNLLLFETIEIPGIESSGNYISSQINSFWESQLNTLANTNMSKTKLSFGIDTYNQATASGGRQEKTSFTYEMERKFMNDRATVKISGKLNDYNDGAYQTNSLFENFIFEYALDSLNTKNLKLYQKRDYEDMLEGEVIKYGAGFLYRKNYKKLSDIWHRKRRLKAETEKNSIN